MKNLFKDKRVKYGTYSTVVAMIFLAILVMINLVVGQFNRSFDTTKDKLFGLSSETQQVLDNMTSKVTIYTTSKTGSSDSIEDRVEQVLMQYKQKSKVGSLSVENIFCFFMNFFPPIVVMRFLFPCLVRGVLFPGV